MENTENNLKPEEDISLDEYLSNPNNAINLLIKGIEIAQKNGSYTLEFSSLLYRAICVFRPERAINSVKITPNKE